MKIKRKKRSVWDWHKKFAWLPVKVDETDNEYSVAWFETVIQCKNRVINSRNKSAWTRYSKKEYFRKKLNGDFDSPQTMMSGEADACSSPHGPALVGSTWFDHKDNAYRDNAVKELQQKLRKNNQ